MGETPSPLLKLAGRQPRKKATDNNRIMKTEFFTKSLDLFGNTVLRYSGPECEFQFPAISHPTEAEAWREAERLLILAIKDAAAKYLSIITHSRAAYFDQERRSKFEATQSIVKGLKPSEGLKMACLKIRAKLDFFESELPRSESRLFPSQSRKVTYLKKMAAMGAATRRTDSTVSATKPKPYNHV